MKKKIFAVACSLSVLISSVFTTYRAFAAVAGSDVVEFIEAPADEILTAVADATGAAAGSLIYSIIIEQAANSLQLQKETNLLVDTNSYNSSTGDYDIAYGIGVDADGNQGLARYGSGGGGGKSRFVQSASDIEVSGETFSEICDRLAEQYAPKADTEYISWKKETHPYFKNVVTLFTAGTFCNNSDWYECYAVPFYFDGEQYYYGYWQYHFYQENGYLCAERYNSVDVLAEGLENYTPVVYGNNSYSLSDYRYASLRVFPDCYSSSANIHTGYLNKFYFYKTYSDYVSGSSNGNMYLISDAYPYNYACDYVSADMTTTICAENDGLCDGSALNTDIFARLEDGSKDLSVPYDIGYFVSNEYIEMTGYIDPIPVEHLEDTTVTLAGDTIYDYTITNNTTGDTSTVNYFVTNNYTYENSGGSSGDSGSSDGGSTSGDVNVGGKVDVSGDIEVGGKVDININVEQGSGSTEDIKGYEYEEVNLEEALEQIPEMSTGFTNWFSRVFAFLPPELMGLLLGGISIAILLRIAGR